MPNAIEVEIERNYAAFKDVLPDLLPAKAGWYALMRDQKLEELFRTAGEAGQAGYERYRDRRFSIQLVAAEPVDLGFYSHAAPHGSA